MQHLNYHGPGLSGSFPATILYVPHDLLAHECTTFVLKNKTHTLFEDEF
jgi:hypothetical protein